MGFSAEEDGMIEGGCYVPARIHLLDVTCRPACRERERENERERERERERKREREREREIGLVSVSDDYDEWMADESSWMGHLHLLVAVGLSR